MKNPAQVCRCYNTALYSCRVRHLVMPRREARPSLRISPRASSALRPASPGQVAPQSSLAHPCVRVGHRDAPACNNQWHAPTAPRPAIAPGYRIGTSVHPQSPPQHQHERWSHRLDGRFRGPVRRGPNGRRHRADPPNPALPGGQDLHLPGLQPGDPTRNGPPRPRPGVGPRQQASLALTLLGASRSATPDRALTGRPITRSLRTRSPGPGRGRAAPPPRQSAQPSWSGLSPGGRAWQDGGDDGVWRQ